MTLGVRASTDIRWPRWALVIAIIGGIILIVPSVAPKALEPFAQPPQLAYVTNGLLVRTNVYVNDVGPEILEPRSLQHIRPAGPSAVRAASWLASDPQGTANLGVSWSAYWYGISPGDELVVSSSLSGDANYWAPVVSNERSDSCSWRINEGLPSVAASREAIPAGARNLLLGYYPLTTNSNLSVFCGATRRIWGLLPDQVYGRSVASQVEKVSGAFRVVIRDPRAGW
jgi:hypothetical protein